MDDRSCRDRFADRMGREAGRRSSPLPCWPARSLCGREHRLDVESCATLRARAPRQPCQTVSTGYAPESDTYIGYRPRSTRFANPPSKDAHATCGQDSPPSFVVCFAPRSRASDRPRDRANALAHDPKETFCDDVDHLLRSRVPRRMTVVLPGGPPPVEVGEAMMVADK